MAFTWQQFLIYISKNMMGKIYLYALIAACPLLIAACGGKAEPVRRFNVIDFDGYKLPGRIEEAKKMGFKDCKSGYGHFECARTDKTTLLGVKTLNASLSLEYKDYFLDDGTYKTELPQDQRVPEKLSYESISFLLPETQYEERCVAKKKLDVWDKPIECRKDDEGTEYLKYKLLTTGWLTRDSKLHRYYFKEDQLIQIHIDRDGKNVDIKQISRKERDSAIQSIKQKISDAQAKQAAQDDVLKKLKD
ncbi:MULTISPECIES: hypothetical protein [Herbaspirillum]|uniref:hypothetical protein n=1 Tax=Herbaspirillum TaxID=963 RepID=UPI0012DE9F64|nr:MULTISPECIES: hypothetical protein [Herbaspirillum]